jgi:hypothetical protein
MADTQDRRPGEEEEEDEELDDIVRTLQLLHRPAANGS